MDDIEDNTSKLLECWDYASKHHKGQWYGSKPYMYHLKKVSDVAMDCNITDESILMSCLLHDIIEDTEVTYKDVKEKNPTWIIENAVKGMLPKNILGRAMVKKLHVYAGESHPHTAQKPETVSL